MNIKYIVLGTLPIRKERMDLLMKKFLKFLLGLTAVAAAVGGILYFLKNVLMKDYLDDYDDDDFDNDLYDEEDDNRDYVTLNSDAEKEEVKDSAEEDEAEPDEMSF